MNFINSTWLFTFVVTIVVGGSLSFAKVALAADSEVVVPSPLLVQSRSAAVASERCAVLLHGLARTSGSMNAMSVALNEQGWSTANVDYPSRQYTVEQLAATVIGQGVAACKVLGAKRIDFVSHSLGGILLRQYLTESDLDEFGRAVMLGPPNHGSEVVDNLGSVPGFAAFNGPAGLQLGTDANSVPNSLGAIKYDVAVVAGTTSINLILSNFIPNPDDGKVSVASARLDGMCAMLTIPVSHPFLMKDKLAIKHTIAYLKTGKFAPDNENTPEYPACGHRFENVAGD